MGNLKLTDADFGRVAEMLGVEKAAVMAVQEVETDGRGGFFTNGRPAILFEGHVFWNQLKKKGINPEEYVAGNEDILYPKWTREHYKGGVKEYERLEKAMKIDEEAALASVSSGMFQIMGFNYAPCGYKNAKDFFEAMEQNEGVQLEAFARLVKANKWADYLKAKDWAGFARRYNGPGYEQNNYHVKIEKAYDKYLKLLASV